MDDYKKYLTYRSGPRESQIDFLLYRRGIIREVEDCKVLQGECVEKQHSPVLAKLVMKTRRSGGVRGEPRIRWWRLKDETVQQEFKKKTPERIGWVEDKDLWWKINSNVIKRTAEELLGKSSGKKPRSYKVSWWWSPNCKEKIEKKKEMKKAYGKKRTEERRVLLKEANNEAKRAVAQARAAALQGMYEELETKEGQRKIYKIAKERNRATKDLTLKYRSGNGGRSRPEKGDIQSCANYRGIKLTSHTMKLLERVMDKRLRAETEQRGLYLTFIDLEKAYDRVPRSEVWRSMRSKGVKEKYVRMTQDMYRDARTRVRSAAGTTEAFSVGAGLHQGSALSPYLFNLLIDVLVEEVTKEAPWSMLFADDIVLVSESREELQERLELWRGLLEDYGLKVRRQKTEYLECNVSQEGALFMQDHKLPKVEAFKYLGSYVAKDGDLKKEIDYRIKLAWNNWRRVSACDEVNVMAARGCKYPTDSLCYVCGEFFTKRAKKHYLDSCTRAKEAYHAYFGILDGNQDKRWAPHIICDYCRLTLEGWFRGEKRATSFAIPRVWRELSDHFTDCFFCMVDPTKRRKGKNAFPIEHPDCSP
ncbi:uncharacterized protein LOC143026873 [Oratosquilla oratoria]|uniref:uncharacterized protein LOC143026873 n=1 Tax=Oratosquilla oratoria TaxID=337810 RepID=UPI003F76A956